MTKARRTRRSSTLGLLAPMLACTPPAVLPEPVVHTAGPAAVVEPVPARPVPSRATPACDAGLGPGGAVLVGGQDTGLSADGGDEARLRVLPWDDQQILLAVGFAHPWWAWNAEGDGQGLLWQIRCDGAAPPRRLFEIPGADLSWSALDVDTGSLYFSMGAVQRYDFAAGDWGPLTAAPTFAAGTCWMAEEPVTGSEYVVARLARNTLLVYVGGPCGFEAEWLGAAQVLEIDGAEVRRRPYRRVAALARGRDDRLWLADGGLCAVGETVLSRGSPGLWRSDDAGAHWTLVPVPALDDGGGSASLGVAAVWAAGDRVLALGECCYAEAADFCFGGELARSDDGGASWTTISPRHVQANPDEFGPVDRLRVDADLQQLEVEVLGFEDNLRMVSRDGGRRWTALAADHEVVASPVVDRSTVGSWQFEPGPEGLLRRHVGAPAEDATRVWPP